ncbi:MAG: zinc-binding dehydrogenase [Nodularia sp. (in: cyanobacteria)]|nr:zinc-binding dehydrogenase [Nodularia sp. (in: cyanobacteria)]
MKAVLMTAAGSPEVLQLQDVPKPTLPLGNSELLVRLVAAGVNPIDIKLRQRGTFYPEQMPAILGCDGAGIVEAVGVWKAARLRNLRVGLELMLTPMLEGLEESLKHHGEILAQCATWMNEGKLKVEVSHRFSLAEAAQAHQVLESGAMIGKVVLLMSDE